MKFSIRLVFLYAALSVFVWLIAGCGSGSPTGAPPTGEQANSAAADKTDAANNTDKPASEYPLLPAAVLNSEVKNLDGTTFSISDKKGKVILLNMWATWCAPCREEMPTLVRLQDTYRDKGFEVIGLNTEENDTREKIERFAEEMKLNYTLVWADLQLQNELVKISQFGGIPQSFLVDREGRLRGIFKGSGKRELAKLEEFIERTVNE
jgi:thiol-disulfide isomerase/thioredoxin